MPKPEQNGNHFNVSVDQKRIEHEARKAKWEERKKNQKTNPTNKDIMDAILDLKADIEELSHF